MIEIKTDRGIYLDLDPASEFELIIENPLFADDRIPVPYSTQISFLPTPANKRTFGYLGALMTEPSAKEIPATIIAGGVSLISGTLQYDSIEEDGKINYTFSGRDLEADWSGKIWEIQGLGHTDDDGYDYDSFLQAYLADEIDGLHPPLIVNSALVAESGYKAEGTTKDNVNMKYRNFPGATDLADVVPAITVARLLSEAALLDISSVREDLEKMVIFGTWWINNHPPTKTTQWEYNAAESLPDISILELIQSVSGIICASVYVYRSRYTMKKNSDVFDDESPLDWNGKISDIFSSEREEKKGYSITFKDDTSTSNSGGVSGSSVSVKSSLLDILGSAEEAEYKAVQHNALKDSYSLKLNNVRYTPASGTGSLVVNEVLIDRLNTGDSTFSSGDGEQYGININLKTVRCVPARCSYRNPNLDSRNEVLRMCPVIDMPSAGSERPTDAYIAVYGQGQASDKGIVFNPSDHGDADCGLSLAPKDLYGRYHKKYAGWLAKDRQVISAAVNLTVYDIATFKMWKKVLVNGRQFLVSELTVRMSAGSDLLSSTCRLESV